MGYYQYQRKSEQERASSRCFEDAKVLLNGKRWGGGAMYLAGYAFECSLKAKLMETHNVRNLEELRKKLNVDVFSHNLEILINPNSVLSSG